MFVKGYVHSFESLAAVDGDGLRCAVFLSGCPMRCVCCHNPDTWDIRNGKETDPKDLANKIQRYKPYFMENGGVTFTGGEPLCQAEFINETALLLKEKGISYAIDTSGCVPLTESVKKALSDSQFVILDLKYWDDASYLKYTGMSMENTLKTLDYLQSIGKNVYMRTVVIPGINDSKEVLEKYLVHLADKSCVKSYELLAFHTMGFFKYENMGIENKLKGREALSQSTKNTLQAFVNEKIGTKGKNISNNC